MYHEDEMNFIVGFYVDASLPKDFPSRTLESLVDEMRADILVGCDGTSARCGVVGEVGCSWPLTGTNLDKYSTSVLLSYPKWTHVK